MMMMSLVGATFKFDDLQINQASDRLSKDWDTPIYIFFKPMPMVKYIDSCKAHVFECAARSCLCKNKFVHWYLDMGDAKSTGNLHQHAKVCWGEEAVATVDNTWDAKTA
jgi:hypothetical protein